LTTLSLVKSLLATAILTSTKFTPLLYDNSYPPPFDKHRGVIYGSTIFLHFETFTGFAHASCQHQHVPSGSLLKLDCPLSASSIAKQETKKDQQQKTFVGDLTMSTQSVSSSKSFEVTPRPPILIHFTCHCEVSNLAPPPFTHLLSRC
jgi:hypothetical protein